MVQQKIDGALTPVQRMLKNTAVLLSGNAAGAVMGLIGALIAARALSPAELGLITLVQGLVFFTDRMINFQCWRAVILYGTGALERNDRQEFLAVIKGGVYLDLISGVSTALLSIAGSFVLAWWLDWSRTIHIIAIIYSCLGFIRLNGTPIGILRIFDKFKAFSMQRMVIAGSKLLGVTLAWILDAGPVGMLISWLLADAFGYIFVIWQGYRELRLQGYSDFWNSSVGELLKRYPELIRFSILSNIGSGVKMITKELDNFVVQYFLGATAVGLYRFGKQFGAIPAQIQDPLIHTIYPELTRAVAAGDKVGFRTQLRSALKIGLAVGGVTVTSALLLSRFFVQVFAPEYIEAVATLQLQIVAIAVSLVFFFVDSALLSFGRADAIAGIASVGTVIFFAAIVPLFKLFGLEGASVAAIAYSTVCAALSLWKLRTLYRQWSPGEPAAQPSVST